MTKLLLVLAAVGISSPLVAAEKALSPRAQANQTRIVSGGGSTVNLVPDQNRLGVAAKAKATAAHPSITAPSRQDPDLVRSQWAAKGSPRGLQQQRESGQSFQIAPLK